MAVTDEAIRRITAMIASGQLKPGDRLARESDLASALGLSRSSLREAVYALSVLGVLDVRQGSGTFVADLGPDSLLEVLGVVADLEQPQTALAAMRVREMLEPAATEIAARSMSAEQIAGLQEDIAEVTEATTGEQVQAGATSFHDRIADSTGNPVLASLLRGLRAISAPARTRKVTEVSNAAVIAQEHQAIRDAIADDRPAVAAALTLVHLAKGRAPADEQDESATGSTETTEHIGHRREPSRDGRDA